MCNGLFQSCDSTGTCHKTYTCYINGIESNKQSLVTMVTRLWDHNFPKIKPTEINGVEISFSFDGPLKEIFEQRVGCNQTATVSII